MSIENFFRLTVILGAIFGCGTSWSAEKKISFPYGKSSADVQIVLKEHDPSAMRTAVFSIQANDIEGEADLVSAPTPNMGRMIVDAKISTIKSTVENMHAPYGGEITKTIECKARKFVRERQISVPELESKLILAVATNRKIFGPCALEEIGNAAIFFAAYDKKRNQVVTVQLFKPLKFVNATVDTTQIEEFQEAAIRILAKLMNGSRS
ncbi:MAG: hypothetical protein J0L82_17245 [Deltaproteobacteria bacterium]|nr:hypothetical protein [Deltaproteobacteria bacterium]